MHPRRRTACKTSARAGRVGAPGAWFSAPRTAARLIENISAEALAPRSGESASSRDRRAAGWSVASRWGDRLRRHVLGTEVGVAAVRARAMLRCAPRCGRRHVVAVEDAALACLEDHARVHVSRGRNGVMISDTEGLVIARFEHRTSRALDPAAALALPDSQQGPRCPGRVVAGVAWRGAVRGGQDRRYALPGRLRAELTRRVGVVWGPVSEHGQAELAGIPQRCWHASAPAPPRSKPPPKPRSPSSTGPRPGVGSR